MFQDGRGKVIGLTGVGRDITALKRGETVLLRESMVDLAGGALRQRWTFLFPDGRRDVRHSAVRLYMPHVLAEMLGEMGYDVCAIASTEEEAVADATRCLPGLMRSSPACLLSKGATVIRWLWKRWSAWSTTTLGLLLKLSGVLRSWSAARSLAMRNWAGGLKSG